jgi:hypothetical protein
MVSGTVDDQTTEPVSGTTIVLAGGRVILGAFEITRPHFFSGQQNKNNAETVKIAKVFIKFDPFIFAPPKRLLG